MAQQFAQLRVFLQRAKEGLDLGAAVQIDMGDDPQGDIPVVARRQDLNQPVDPRRLVQGEKTKRVAAPDGFDPRRQFVRAEHNLVGRGLRQKPSVKRRAAVGIFGADEAVTTDFLGRAGKPVGFAVGLGPEQRHLLHEQRLHHIVGLLRATARADCHMRLAVFQPEDARIGHITHPKPGVLRLQRDQHRRDQPGQTGQRGHDQFARKLRTRAGDAGGKLGKLIVRRPRDLQEFLPRLGRGVAARMALKEPHAKPPLKRVDMADDGRVVNAQRVRRARHRPQPGNLISRPNLVPVLERHAVHPSTDIE